MTTTNTATTETRVDFTPDALIINGNAYPCTYELRKDCILLTVEGHEPAAIHSCDPDWDAVMDAMNGYENTLTGEAVTLWNGWIAEPVPEEQLSIFDLPAEPEPSADTKTAAAAEVPEASAESSPAAVDKPWIGTTIRGSWWEIAFDGDARRTRLTLSHEPSEKAAAYIQGAGFWAAKDGTTFTRKLTCKAYRAALALAAQLSCFHR